MLRSYTVARWLRSRAWLAAVLSVAALMLLFLQIGASTRSRAQSLTEMIDRTRIRCVVVNRAGQAENLHIPNGSILYFFLNEPRIIMLCDELEIRSSCTVEAGDESFLLTGATASQMRRETEGGQTIAYDGAEDAALFDGRDAVAVIGSALMPYTEEENGARYITVRVAEVEEPLRLRVTGTSDAERAFYCPWATLFQWNFYISADRLNFVLSDNRLLAQAKDLSERIFDSDNPDNTSFAKGIMLSVQSAEYETMTNMAYRNQIMMTLIKAVSLICAVVAGLMLSILLVRGRRQEYAVLRSMGVGGAWIVAQGMLEVVCPCFVVFCLAYLTGGIEMADGLPLFLSYVIGYLAPLGYYCMQPILKQIQMKEKAS